MSKTLNLTGQDRCIGNVLSQEILKYCPRELKETPDVVLKLACNIEMRVAAKLQGKCKRDGCWAAHSQGYK